MKVAIQLYYVIKFNFNLVKVFNKVKIRSDNRVITLIFQFPRNGFFPLYILILFGGENVCKIH